MSGDIEIEAVDDQVAFGLEIKEDGGGGLGGVVEGGMGEKWEGCGGDGVEEEEWCY